MIAVESEVAGRHAEHAEGSPTPTVLIVDDQPVERRLAGRMAERVTGLTAVYAGDGREALEVLARGSVAVVLTDLQMPGMSGLELVEAVRDRHPEVPVVLMTAFGSEEVAVGALRAGAASYVPKRELKTILGKALRQVLAVAADHGRRRRLAESAARRVTDFRIANEPELLAPLVELLVEDLGTMGFGDATGRMRIGVALQEALANALYHGNLEVSSDLRQDDEQEFYKLATRRRQEEPYRHRAIEVHADVAHGEASFTVSDEGPGFDTSRLDRPIDPEDLTRVGGRGLLLIRTFMDEVAFNKRGNCITMVARPRPGPGAPTNLE